MTKPIYYPSNEYQKQFDATVDKSNQDQGYIVLDQTLFYKQGGGQPPDHGKISWDKEQSKVVDVQKENGEVRHYLEGEVPLEGTEMTGNIDWDRRYKHMRMHTAQHIVSKVVLDEYKATTAGNQVKAEKSTIDFEPADFDEEDLDRIEEKSNEIIDADIELEKSEMPREQIEEQTDQNRSNLDLIPDHIDPLRAVEIGEIDICPCGGTHVDSTGEVGEIEIVNRVSKGSDVERLEFVLKKKDKNVGI